MLQMRSLLFHSENSRALKILDTSCEIHEERDFEKKNKMFFFFSSFPIFIHVNLISCLAILFKCQHLFNHEIYLSIGNVLSAVNIFDNKPQRLAISFSSWNYKRLADSNNDRLVQTRNEKFVYNLNFFEEK